MNECHILGWRWRTADRWQHLIGLLNFLTLSDLVSASRGRQLPRQPHELCAGWDFAEFFPGVLLMLTAWGRNWQEADERIGQPRVHHHNHHNSLPKPDQAKKPDTPKHSSEKCRVNSGLTMYILGSGKAWCQRRSWKSSCNLNKKVQVGQVILVDKKSADNKAQSFYDCY